LLVDLVSGVCFPRQPLGLKQRFDRLELGASRLLHLLRCLAYRGQKPPGMQAPRQCGPVLPPGTAHLLPGINRGGTDRYPGLELRAVATLCLGVWLPRLQAWRGVFEVPFGVPQPTEDGQRLALSPVMAQGKQVREA
jgi:hypothetical protein